MIGIIGGTGLERCSLFEHERTLCGRSVYGEASSQLMVGHIAGKEVVLLSRHGRQHTITPSGINYRANIDSLRNLGCHDILATTACGSLRQHLAPGQFVLPDQFIDFTKHRQATFYADFPPNKMHHCPMATPFSEPLRNSIAMAANSLNINDLHRSATILTIEGPRFSTKAESNMFRTWGADLINMTTATEAALANEAQLNYAAIAIVTDYDCWKDDEEHVSIEMVMANFQKNIQKLMQLIIETIKIL